MTANSLKSRGSFGAVASVGLEVEIELLRASEDSMIEKRPSEFDDIRLKLFLHVNYLLGEIDISHSSKNFDNVFFLLDSLLMPTVEYDLAKKRIDNAQRYVRSGELGGARFELRMVLGWIRSYLDPVTIKTYVVRGKKPKTIKLKSSIE